MLKQIMLTVLLALVSTHLLAESFTIVGDDDFPPFSFKTETGEITGADIEVLKELEKRSGFNFSVELVPWKRLLLMTEQGKIAGSFALFDTPSRRQFARFTHPIHYSTYRLFTKKTNPITFTSVKDLYRLRIGIEAGFATHPALEQADKEGHIELVGLFTYEDLFNRLVNGSLDAIIGNEPVVQYQLSSEYTQYADEIIMGDAIQEARGAYLVFSKNAGIENLDVVVGKITKHMKAMEEEGVTQRIYEKFMQAL